MADIGAEWIATQILVVADPARSRDWWTGVLGARVHREYGGSSVVLRFAGMWVLLVAGGEPTPDKPVITANPLAKITLVRLSPGDRCRIGCRL